MAKDFVKLSEVAVLEEVSDTASVLIEENGEIYRAPKTQVGGAGGVKTAIIRSSNYLDAIEGMKNGRTGGGITYECLNMTFEEAYQIMESGEPLVSLAMIVYFNAPATIYGTTAFLGTTLGNPCIGMIFMFSDDERFLYWTADGISIEMPGGEAES